jgi:uncharacterized protein YndB with AHSA1/START domain
MDPFTVSTTIDRPREEVFAYLADIANHQEFTDHYLVDYRMTREATSGQGAGARFTVKAPLNRFNQADVTFVEVDAPRRIVEAGRTGKFNRIRTRGVYTLEPGPGGTTRVEFTFEAQPALLTDRIMASLGVRGWMRRNTAKALRRLRSILEEDRGRGRRATIAGR